MDFEDVLQAKSLNRDLICQIAAARELYEETGIDIRQNLNRLQSLRPYEIGGFNRFFFELLLTQEDSIEVPKYSADSADQQYRRLRPNDETSFCLRLSDEHTGFNFVETLDEAATEVKLHSGGHCSKALLQYRDKLRMRGASMLYPEIATMASISSGTSYREKGRIYKHGAAVPSEEATRRAEPRSNASQLFHSCLSACVSTVAACCSCLMWF